MSAYGRALLLLLLDEAKDERGNELAQALTSEAQSAGELSWWAVDHDPLLFDFADTSVEATATALQAIASHDPSSPILDRGVRWLMVNRRGGYWSSTKQTAIALYGLLEVLQARNETAEPFSVDVYVNGESAGSRSFTAASLAAPDPIVVTAPGSRRRQQRAAREERRRHAVLVGAGPLLRHAGCGGAQRQRVSSRSRASTHASRPSA